MDAKKWENLTGCRMPGSKLNRMPDARGGRVHSLKSAGRTPASKFGEVPPGPISDDPKHARWNMCMYGTSQETYKMHTFYMFAMFLNLSNVNNVIIL